MALDSVLSGSLQRTRWLITGGIFNINDKELYKEMLLKASGTYTKDDLMCLVNEIDRNTFDLLVKQSNINIFESSDTAYEFILETEDVSGANKYIKKAIENNIKFTPEQILGMSYLLDEDTFASLAIHSSIPFTKDELEELQYQIDDASFEKVCDRAGIRLVEEEIEEFNEPLDADEILESFYEPEDKPSLLSTIIAGIAFAELLNNLMNKKK